MKEERKLCVYVKWFYGQSERAQYLNYFIKGNRGILGKDNVVILSKVGKCLNQ